MKTPSFKTALILATALACAGTSTTAFARTHSPKVPGYAASDPLVYRPADPGFSDSTCTSPSDWRCPNKDSAGG